MKIARRDLLASITGSTLVALMGESASAQSSAYTRNPRVSLKLKQTRTIGSISSGSNMVALAANVGFQVGDGIIVEVGGERGGGARGTFGVGGVYPTLSYPNLAAMQADASQRDGTWAYCRDTLKALRWSPKYNEWHYYANQYYNATIVPRSLNAVVTAVSSDGLTLTLNANASTSTQNANVYFDNAGVFAANVTAWAEQQNLQINVPAGSFAFSTLVTISAQKAWVLSGQGEQATTLFSPRGAQGLQLEFSGCTNCVVEKLTLKGNMGANGYQLFWDDTGTLSFFGVPLLFQSCANCMASSITSIDGQISCLTQRNCTNCWFDSCHWIMSEATQEYTSWMIGVVDSVGGGARNCTGTCPELIAGCETFRSDGTSFINITLMNATYAANGANKFLFENCTAVIKAGTLCPSFPVRNPVFNINSNIGPSGGGSIIDPTIIQEGYVDPEGNSLIGIVINAGSDNVRVAGTYPACDGAGYIEIPDHISTRNDYSGVGINSSGKGTVVSGIRFLGHANYAGGLGNIFVQEGSLTAIDNVMDHPVAANKRQATFTEAGTQSNASWGASCSS